MGISFIHISYEEVFKMELLIAIVELKTPGLARGAAN
jgi:hypothetical protein